MNRQFLLNKGTDSDTAKKYQSLIKNIKPQKNISYKTKKGDGQITILDVISVYKANTIDDVEIKQSESTRKKRAIAILSKFFKRLQDTSSTYNTIY
jgi:hypothetical protein